MKDVAAGVPWQKPETRRDQQSRVKVRGAWQPLRVGRGVGLPLKPVRNNPSSSKAVVPTHPHGPGLTTAKE